MKIETSRIEPCPDCPYPTNFTASILSVDDGKERYAVSCRECGDSWVEEVQITNEGKNDE